MAEGRQRSDPAAPAKRYVTPYHRWSKAETRIADRFALRLIRGQYANANAAVSDCQQALRRAGFLAHLEFRTVGNKLRKRSSDLGRRKRFLWWGRTENRIAEEFARAVAAERYPDVKAAVPDCRRALARAGLPLHDAGSSIAGKLWRLSELYGRKKRFVEWTPDEDTVGERFARAVINGRYASVTSAVPDCRKALARLGLRERRTWTAVRHHVTKIARRLGRPPAPPKWSAAEEEVLDRHGRALVAGEYRTVKAAAVSAHREIRRLRTGVPRELSAVEYRLQRRTRGMGRGKPLRMWTRAEIALAQRYAQAMARGVYADAMEAARACAAALERLPATEKEPPPRRSLGRVHNVLLPMIRRRIYPWRHTGWLPAELRLADVYARAAVEHRYPSVLHAARACQRAIGRYHRRRLRGIGRPPSEIRAIKSVFDKVMRRAKQLGRYRLSNRRWTRTELRVSARWCRKYQLHREGRLAMNLKTISTLMRAELDRLGYYRTLHACVTQLITESHAPLTGR